MEHGQGKGTDLFQQLFSIAMFAPIVLGDLYDATRRKAYTHDEVG